MATRISHRITSATTALSAAATLALLGCNQPPTNPTVTLTPEAPFTTDTLNVTYEGSTDPNANDTVNYRISWSRNGDIQAALGDAESVVPRETAKGQEWMVTVTPFDGKVLGNSVSASVTIQNSAPVAVATWVDDAPAHGDRLKVDVDKSDADVGDSISIAYQWSINGAAQDEKTDTIQGSRVLKGDVWEVSITATDGETPAEPIVLALTIANTPPTVASARVSSDTPDKSSSLQCIGEGWEDIDGDLEAYDVEWTVNGTVTSTDTELAVADMARGDRVRCTLTPNDGDDTGPPVSSDEVIVQNTAPSITSVSIGPDDPIKDVLVTATVEGASDPDGDPVSYRYEWIVNGALAGETDTLPSSRFRKDDSIRLTITPTDGVDDGEPVRSNIITAGNNLPIIDRLTVSPTDVYTDTVLATELIASDFDGDTVSYAYEWSVNGTRIGATDAELDGTSWFDKGDRVQLKVTPTDRTDFGAAVTSPTMTVLNSLPTEPGLVLNPETPKAGEDVLCELDEVSIDADGDSLTYSFRWEVNGARITGVSTTTYTDDTLPSSKFSDGDTVVCYASANDGTADGPEGATTYGSETNPGVDCKDILDERPKYESGIYWIDPDDDGDASDAYEVYCDMTTDGGGWTLVYYVDAEHFDGYYGNSSTAGSTVPTEINADSDVWDIPSDLNHDDTLFACSKTNLGPDGGGTNYWRYNNATPYSNFNKNTSSGYRYQTSNSSSTSNSTCYADYVGASSGSYGFFVLETSGCGGRAIVWGAYHYSFSAGYNNTDNSQGSHTSEWRSRSIIYPICDGTQTKTGQFWIGVR